ncbi:FAD-dependent monooxygenase [Streptomyces sp. NBC_01210]|uniref:FAD-dependent monooxygenase n=1 Tax=Streptomyces sp. NBC_01210 TaxID=2903774 RepID=UPI002E1270E6
MAQQDIEQLLGGRADELGVDVRRGVELTGFDADDGAVTVWTSGGAIRAGWLVGCDGGRSTVRKLAGFEFPGTDPEITCHQAVVEMTGAEDLKVGWTATDAGVYAHGPMPGRVVTVEFDGPSADRDAPVTTEDLQARLRRASGVDVTITGVRTATRFTDHARQVTEYRKGRVLLAGDAAHVHSAFGSQGLSLGIGDAMNLGWKLAAVIGGRAPEGLLDTYTSERHPVGAWVLDWTRSQVAAMRPDPQSRALREIVSDLAGTVVGTTYLTARLNGAGVRYDLPGEHPLTGRSAPDLELTDGGRLADHLHGGRALLLDLTDDPGLRALAAGYAGRVDTLTAGCPSRPELAAVLVRPDGFTAWAADAGARRRRRRPGWQRRWGVVRSAGGRGDAGLIRRSRWAGDVNCAPCPLCSWSSTMARARESGRRALWEPRRAAPARPPHRPWCECGPAPPATRPACGRTRGRRGGGRGRTHV